jgi:hypothetical protein
MSGREQVHLGLSREYELRGEPDAAVDSQAAHSDGEAECWQQVAAGSAALECVAADDGSSAQCWSAEIGMAQLRDSTKLDYERCSAAEWPVVSTAAGGYRSSSIASERRLEESD